MSRTARSRSAFAKASAGLLLLTQEQEAGRVGRAEVVSRLRRGSLRSARVERAPKSAVIPGLASQEFLAQLHDLAGRPAALAPYDHEPVQRVSKARTLLDLAVSCPASSASAVRFARWSVGSTRLSQR